MKEYRNGYGQKIYNPKAYFKAVREDRYGYNRTKRGWIVKGSLLGIHRRDSETTLFDLKAQ